MSILRSLPALTSVLLLAACATQVPPATNTPSQSSTTPPDSTASCSCNQPPAKPEPIKAVFKPATWSDLPDWTSGGLTPGWPAWLEGCKRLAARPQWKAACEAARTMNPQDEASLRQFFEFYFQPWQVNTSDGHDQGLITGYYEPLLAGTHVRKPGSVPLYGVPDDLLTIDLGDVYPELKGMRLRGRLDGKKVVPYWDRAGMDAGHVPPADKVLAWVNDPLEAFFLEVQGSGRIRFEDGSMMRVGYADQNGYPYKSIGKWLVDQGELKVNEASMQGIQAWVRLHPERLHELLDANPSYVFFHALPNATGGPVGAFNVPLTDGYSAAVDPKFIPLGVPLYLSTTYPNDDKPLNRLLQAQDTGGAIRGPIRVDLFWGFGAEPASLAGKMRQQGRVWIFWPKGAEPPVSK